MMIKTGFRCIAILFVILLALPLQAQMTFDGSGNVGIGTETPGSKLDVSGTANMTTLSIGATPVTATATELNYVDAVTSSIQTQVDAKAATASPVFTGTATLPGDGTWDLDGYVGIGTTAPVEKLTLAEGNFLQTSGNPIQIGSIAALNGAQSIYVSGKYAYVAVREGDAVKILDISNPSNPTSVGNISDDGLGGIIELDGATSIYISGKYAYVASYIDDGVEILDISDPTNPTHVGSITDDATTALDGAKSIYISGKYAYVAAEIDHGVEILDISDPTNPTHVGCIFDDGPGGSVALYWASSIYVYGKYAYVTDRYDGGVEILDISDPTNPTHVGSIFDDGPGGIIELDGATSIYISGKYAYVASYIDEGVEILDISDPTNPTHVGAITDDNPDTTELDGAISIYVSGKYAYVAARFDHGVEILDISDPTNPTHVGAISDDDPDITELNGASSVYVSGKYAYIAASVDDGVGILDISGIDTPAAHIGSIATSTLNVSENAQVGNNLHVNGGLNVGPGGLKSDGPVSIYANIDNDGTNAVLKIVSGGQTILFDGNEIDTTHSTLHLNYNTGSDLQVGVSGDGSEARANAWNGFSDLRLKQDITPIANPLSLLGGINGVYYTWKEGKDKSRQVGVIAQEIEKVLPEVVSEDLKGYKSVAYGKITALLVEAVKELKQQNKVLQKENRKMQEDIRALQDASRM